MNDVRDKMRRSARRLRYATLAFLVAIEALMLIAAAVLLLGRREQVPLLRIEDGGLAAVPAAAALVLVAALVGLALLRLLRMLRRIETGQPFRTAGELRSFAFWLLLAGLAGALAGPVAAALGGGEVELSLDLATLLGLLLIGLLFLVARLLDEAQAVADDASQIV